MLNIFKKILLVTSIGGVALTTATIISNEIDIDNEQPSYIESIKLDSSRYSRVDDLSVVDTELYIDIKSSDELIAENDKLRLYYDEDIISFKIENKDTNYVFATHIDRVSAGTYDSLLSGGLGIEYIQVTKGMNIVENVGITDIALTQEITQVENGIKVSLDLGGFCPTRTCKRNYEFYLEGLITLEQLMGFGYIELNMGFDFIVTLEEDGIRAEIPYESIREEKTDEILLSSLIVFPALGATKLDEIPGYMMIPDGAGALVRYEDNEGRYKSPYRAQFYGINYGLRDNFITVANYTLSMPIFGMVHGVNQNGLLGIVESGDYSSRLFMFQNGANNLDYNLVFPKFDIRKTFRQSFTTDNSSGTQRVVDTSSADIAMLYKVLDNDEANYVGMANKYKEYLKDKGILDSELNSQDIPLHLDYLMADSKNALLGKQTIEMSNTDDVLLMHEYFLLQGLSNFNIGLMGWNDGGYSGNLPSSVDFDGKLGSTRSFKNLIEELQKTSEVSLINSYVYAGEEADSISERGDIAKGIDRLRLQYQCTVCVYEDQSLLYPESTLRLGTKHFEDYMDLNVNVTFEMLGNTLFSYYDSGYYSREDSYSIYQEMMSLYDGKAGYLRPNAYAFEYMSSYYQAPMFNSQLKYFDDLVPVLQIVLMGEVPLFSDYLNFNSYGQEFLLQLIDFNVYPSFVLTMNPSSLLKDTDIEYIYTSEFDLWKDTVVEQYDFINDALKHVIGETLVSREVPVQGIVKNTYSNGVIIYINYTSTDKVYEGITIGAINYALGGDVQ
ncbi:MAG: DUF5696 domain-containing protein [Candidatus Izemoplasmatales bacterium]|nr:DUF5696 domain-containing protein [Candidatus Izemoplasmatales bacterium]